jgi:hypothetical protein
LEVVELLDMAAGSICEGLEAIEVPEAPLARSSPRCKCELRASVRLFLSLGIFVVG